jgi:hypothetical protein
MRKPVNHTEPVITMYSLALLKWDIHTAPEWGYNWAQTTTNNRFLGVLEPQTYSRWLVKICNTKGMTGL